MLRSGYRYNKLVEMINGKNLDITGRSIPFSGGSLTIFYIKQLVDSKLLSEYILKPLMRQITSEAKSINTETAVNKSLYAADCKIEDDEDKIINHILTGMVIVLFSTDTKYLVINVKEVERRKTAPPEIEYVLRGARDCFVENLDANISLVRNRIKDEKLRIKSFEIGVRTKSRVAVMYIEDIANETVVNELQKRIESIDIDGIYESGELQAFLLNKKTNLFPQMGLIERSDMAARLLLDGRVVTLVDGGALAIFAPITFNEFFYSCDDFYDNKYFGLFSRIIRYLSLLIAFSASSLYVAVTSFHTDAMPSSYAIMLAEMNANVPFPAIIGAMILELLMEIIRESLIRVPKHIGSAIGIVGAIVIGQAAVSAGIFSPLLLIIASLSMLASFVITDYTLMNVFRILKFILLICTGIFGFYGFTLFLCLILANMVSINSFGVPYMAPYAPYNLYDYLRSFMDNKTISPHRTNFLKDKDTTRQRKQ